MDETIGGYRLAKLMMTGQTSQVWEVVELASGRHFAMKLLLPEKLRLPEFRRSLFHEAAVGIRLRHPNVIRIISVNRDRDNPHFIMEFFPAGSLKLRIMRKQFDFIKERAHDIFRQWATALAYMNESGWVHRDVKADNVLVNAAGELRVIDFALATRVRRRGFFSRLFSRRSAGKVTRTSGTRSYMSPEQIRNEPLDGRADIYSFAASAYEVVTGRPPFRAITPAELLQKQLLEKPVHPMVHNPEVTEEFGDLLLHCLAKRREDRPKNFHEVLIALRGMRVFKGEPAAKKEE